MPVIVRTTEDMLRLVPTSLREGSAALGAQPWRTVTSVIYPAARSGLVTGTLLAIARISGRDRAAALYGAQQPVLEHRPHAADGEPAERDLPVCDEPL